jgi:hypothetical protein
MKRQGPEEQMKDYLDDLREVGPEKQNLHSMVVEAKQLENNFDVVHNSAPGIIDLGK